jgi:predicted alpha/beta-fold hydrolase
MPRPGLWNGHLQTIVGNFLPRTPEPSLPQPSSEWIEVVPATQTQISSQVLCHCHWHPRPADHLTVILVHGLEGSSDSHYIEGNSGKMWVAGFNVVRMNMRNCGDTDTQTPTLYHSGLSGDVGTVLAELAARFALTRFALCGYSMGGNLVLKLAGELGAKESRLVAVAAVSPALDLSASAHALHRPINRLYERRFLRNLLRRYRRKVQFFPELYDPARADGIRSIVDFDEFITAPYSGFSGAEDYYHRAAAARVLDGITVPTLIIHAEDDPFIRLTDSSRAALLANPAITLLASPHGGHCAFLCKPNPAAGNDGYWAESTVLQFLAAHASNSSHLPNEQFELAAR